MHKFSFVPVFRRLAVLPSVFLLTALVALSPSTTAHAQTTTFTGKVYSPAGPVTGDPIPNILVFIAVPGVTMPTFTQGVTIPTTGQNGCDVQPDLVPQTVMGEALTGPDGVFTFSITGSLPAPTMNVVIQAGKWRLQTPVPTAGFTAGSSAPISLGNFSMPSHSGSDISTTYGTTTTADLPHIAVVTGEADQIECIFRQIGIDDKLEVTDPSGTGSINLFKGNIGGGEVVSTSSPTEAQLLNGTVPITNYDLVMFGCQSTGGPNDSLANKTTIDSTLVPYANEGGRIFATHYEYIWLKNATAWNPMATWMADASFNGGQTSTISSTIQNGTLINWLADISAFNVNPALDELSLDNVREDTSAVHTPAVSWANRTADGRSLQFSFDTPIGTAGTPSVAVSYTNNQTQLLQGDASDSVVLKVTNSSTTATLPNLQMAISVPLNITVSTPPVDSSGGNWTCVGTSPTITCTLPVALAAGTSDSVTLTFSIATNAAVGQASLTAALTGGGISNAGQCGRVLFNDYHVEEPLGTSQSIGTGTLYGTGANAGQYCPAPAPGGTLTSAQKFLEYSLYNLSNFVSPSTTDLLLIQGAAELTWNPTSKTFYYGTPYSPNTALDDATSAIAGNFTYTSNSTVNPLDVGTWTITATFTPTDPDYIASSTSTNITISSDPTSSTLDTSAPLPTFFYGQPLVYPGGLSAAVDIKVIAPGYTTQLVNAGAYSITLDGNVACTGTAGGANTCATPTLGTLDAGTHNVQLSYAGTANTDFLPSNSPLYPVVISPDPTTTTMTASATTAVNLQPLTFTAAVTDTYTAAVGPVTFYDSTTTGSTAGITPVGSPIGTATLDGTGHATLTSTTVFTGTHNISACFTPALNSLNTYNYVLSCSASTQIVVNTIAPSSPVATSTVLSSNANPSAVGQSVSFTASVSTSGSFASIPTGSVQFLDGAAPLSTVPLDATGAAVFTTSTLTVGNHPITAVYAGNTTLAGSTSAVLTQIVNTPIGSAGTGFLLVFGTTGVDVPIGSSGVVQIRVIELNNFNQPIKLACSGLPSEAACTFATDTLPSSGGTTQLAVSAQAPHDCTTGAPYFVTPAGETGWIAFAVLVLCFARRRRKLQGLALLVLLALLPMVLTGCGSNCTDFGVKPGTYTFTITATSTGSPAVVQTQTMTMNAHL